MHNLLERVKSLQWPIITVVKLKDKTHFRTVAQLLIFIPQKNFLLEKVSIFQSYKEYD